MAFDIKTAKPLSSSGVSKFDMKTAKPIDKFNAPEDLVVRVISNIVSGGGLPGIVGGAKNPEDSLPMVGQFIGGVGSGFGGYLGSVAGASTGQVARQGVKTLKQALGDKSSFPDFGEVKNEAIRTAAIEGAFRGGSKLVFGNEFAAKAIKELGSRIGKMKDAVIQAGEANPAISVPLNVIKKDIREVYDSILVKSGTQVTQLRKWLRALDDAPNSAVGLTPKALAELESDLGELVKWEKSQVGGVNITPEFKKRSLNAPLKKLREKVSTYFDDLAEKAGQGDWKKISVEFSKMKKKFPDSKLNRGGLIPGVSDLATSSVLGGALASLTGNPGSGLAAFTLSELLQSRELRNSLFRIFTDKKLGNVLSASVSEGARRVLGDG